MKLEELQEICDLVMTMPPLNIGDTASIADMRFDKALRASMSKLVAVAKEAKAFIAYDGYVESFDDEPLEMALKELEE